MPLCGAGDNRGTVHTFRAVAFLDEDESEALPLPDEPERPQGRPPRPPRSPRQQILVRRLIAAGGAVLLLILIVLGFRGCLEARKERAIKNFISDSGALMGESEQTGQDFFGLLNDSGGATALEYEAQIKSYRGASETLFERAQNLDAPDELADGKQSLVTTLQLRRNGLTEIGNQIGTALGQENATEAQQSIVDQMRLLFASDAVCTGVALPEIVDVAEKEGVTTDDGEPINLPCAFVADPPESWLELDKITESLSQVTGESTTATPGLHGLELVSTSIGDTTLDPGVPATASSASAELVVEVTNGGESEETDVAVDVTVGDTELSETIPRIGAGETTEVKIPISPLPPSGEQSTVEVNIEPVAGEELTDNNSSTYTVTFE